MPGRRCRSGASGRAQNIADWKGFLQGETYTYSVVWLLLGVLLLALGSRFNAKSIRIASAVLVFVAVLKVFLIDMANLEGFLRALSFIGLGAVLIGIGLFYQKILSGKASDASRERQTPVDIEARTGPNSLTVSIPCGPSAWIPHEPSAFACRRLRAPRGSCGTTAAPCRLRQ